MVKGYRLSASTGIHKGDRDYQQDRVALLRHRNAIGCLLGVVADGMGGRSGGRKASDQVMLTAGQLFERYDPGTDDATSLLLQLGREAHTVIKLTAIASEQEPHSTIAAFLINPGGDCHWVHAGDSRLYHFRLGKLVKRSLDHSYVQALVNAGELDKSEAADHPKANILIGCLGTEADPPLESHLIARVRPGDVIMACSDGIWHLFSDEELGQLVSTKTPRAVTEHLIDSARSRGNGCGDNLSLVVVRIEPLTVPQEQGVKEAPRPVEKTRPPVASARRV